MKYRPIDLNRGLKRGKTLNTCIVKYHFEGTHNKPGFKVIFNFKFLNLKYSKKKQYYYNWVFLAMWKVQKL